MWFVLFVIFPQSASPLSPVFWHCLAAENCHQTATFCFGGKNLQTICVFFSIWYRLGAFGPRKCISFHLWDEGFDLSGHQLWACSSIFGYWLEGGTSEWQGREGKASLGDASCYLVPEFHSQLCDQLLCVSFPSARGGSISVVAEIVLFIVISLTLSTRPAKSQDSANICWMNEGTITPVPRVRTCLLTKVRSVNPGGLPGAPFSLHPRARIGKKRSGKPWWAIGRRGLRMWGRRYDLWEVGDRIPTIQQSPDLRCQGLLSEC